MTSSTELADRIEQLIEPLLRGDVRLAARLMRDLDDRRPEAIEALKRLFPHTGKAYITGITGNPGAGKSTVVDALIAHYRAAGERVGVIAVDPTSPFSGGAILGDRIRMQRHALDNDVFIRSLATRGHLGGLSRSTFDVAHVLDAMGYTRILIETLERRGNPAEALRAYERLRVLLRDELGIAPSPTLQAVHRRDRKSTRLNSSHHLTSRMPSSA